MKRLAIIATFLLSILLTAFISSYFYEFRSRIRGLNYDPIAETLIQAATIGR